MTTTLILSTLLGAATSYPLLKRWTGAEAERLKVIEDGWRTLLFPLMAVLLTLPFFRYSIRHASLVMLLALVAAWSPTLAMIILVGVFLAMSGLWTLLFIPLILSPVLPLLFLVPQIRAAFTVVIETIIEFFEQYPAKSYSFLRIVVCAACLIIASEAALLSANAGWFFSDSPGICAWIGGERAVPILMESLRSNDPDVHSQAMHELAQLGEAAVPALMAEIEKQPSNHPEDLAWRNAAAVLLQGPQATKLFESKKISMKKLISFLNHYDSKVRSSVSDELIRIGRPALPDLLARLKAKPTGWREVEMIIYTLRQIVSVADVPELLEVATAYENKLPLELTNLLISIGPSAIPALIDGFRHPYPQVRELVRQTLVKTGDPAVIPLTEALKNKDPQIRSRAAITLEDLGVLLEDSENIRNQAVIAVLVKSLNNPDAGLRYEVLETLRTTSWTQRKSSFPVLFALLNDPDDQIVQVAASLIVESADISLLPAFEKAHRKFHRRLNIPHDPPGSSPLCELIRELKAR